MKRTELIFHRLHCFITLSVCSPSVVNQAHAVPENVAVSISIWEVMAVVRASAWGAGSEPEMPPLSRRPPQTCSVTSRPRQQRPAPTSRPWPKPERVSGSGGPAISAARKPPCMFACVSPSVLSPGLCNKLYSVNRELLLIELKSNFLN